MAHLCSPIVVKLIPVLCYLSTYYITFACVQQNQGHGYSCRNEHLATLPSDIPSSTLVLDFTNNKLSKIDRKCMASLPKLSYLFLGSNIITDIEEGSFINQSGLIYLTLQKNDLKTLRPHTFDGLTHLKELNIADNKEVELMSGTLQPLSALEAFIGSKNRLLALYNFSFLPALRYFVLDMCEITSLYEGNFKGLHVLKGCHLNHNFLRNIPSNVLRCMPLLENLQIEFNLIESLSSDDFQGNPKIKHIYLRGNRIGAISQDTFQGLPKLSRIDLADNNIIYFENLALGPALPNQNLLVILDGNHLYCDCNIRSLVLWAHGRHHNIRGGICSAPTHTAGKNLDQLELDDLQCPPVTKQITSKEGSNITLACPVTADPALTVWWSTPVKPSNRLYVGDNDETFDVLQDGTLSINATDVSIAGDYFCQIENDDGYVDGVVHLIVTKSQNAWLIFTIFIAAVSLVVFILYLAKKSLCPSLGNVQSLGYQNI